MRPWLAAAVVVSAIAPAASGQSTRAIRWARGSSILVWIDESRAPADGPRLVERAMRTWTDAAGGRFALVNAPPSAPAPVRVRFLRDDANYGETRPLVDRQTGLIASADVTINADVGGDAITRQIVVYLTALHELGHALGLPHTDDFGDIMYSFRRPDDGERYFGAYRRKLRAIGDIGSSAATGLSAADVTALRQLYDR
jgi:hypothetical protein